MNSSAPTSRTRESATCETTRRRRSPKPSRAVVMPRPPDFMAAPGSVRVARNAGVSPKRMLVRTARLPVNAKTRQSGVKSKNMPLPSVMKREIRIFEKTGASSAPTAVPMEESNRLSDNSWRISRPRDAPIARRTAISRSRALARASIRLARFAHAINKHQPGGCHQNRQWIDEPPLMEENPLLGGKAPSRRDR